MDLTWIGENLVSAGSLCLAAYAVYFMALGKDEHNKNPPRFVKGNTFGNRNIIPTQDLNMIISQNQKKKVRKVTQILTDKELAAATGRMKYVIEFDDNSVVYTYARNKPYVDGNGYLQTAMNV